MIIRDKKGRFVKGNQYWLGKHHTKITKEKIKKKALSREISEEHKKILRRNAKKYGFKKGHPQYGTGMLGKKHTEKFKKELSKRNKKLGIEPPHYKGEKNSNWRGGISREPYDFNFGEELKKLIKKRDKFTCQICGKKPKVLYVHHIDYDKQNSNSKNLISLCNSCHSKTNYGRDKWKKYFRNKAKI